MDVDGLGGARQARDPATGPTTRKSRSPVPRPKKGEGLSAPSAADVKAQAEAEAAKAAAALQAAGTAGEVSQPVPPHG